MDDLAGKLNQILNSPEGMEQMKRLASMLGQSNPAPSSAASSAGGLENLLSGLMGSTGGTQPPAPPEVGPEPDILNLVTRLAPLLSSFREEDNNTRLLAALRPLLGESRRKKLDEASQMLRMLKLLPLLKGQGIL